MYCPSCRGEYREGFSWCQDCDTALVDALPEESPPEEDDSADEADEDSAAAEDLTAQPDAQLAALSASDKRLRALELLLVLFVAFGSSVVLSLIDWWRGVPSGRDYSASANVSRLLRLASALGVLAYVLFRQGRSLRQLGLTVRRRDSVDTLLLTAFTFAPSMIIDRFFYGSRYAGPAAHPLASLAGGTTLSPLLILALLTGAACEELISRAYLMTEVMALGGGVVLAILASTGFQTLYHLYQGTSGALTSAWAFLICSIYYAYNRRVTPLILAHFLYNFLLFGSWAHG